MMDLLLWRHAEAEDGDDDFKRRLTDRGEKQARTMATAPRSIVTAADIAELESVSRGMVEAGERAVRISEILLASTSQIQRWLGVPR